MKTGLKHRLLLALIRSYPSRWRKEYGTELLALLQRHPLTAATIVDVAWNGWRQRLRWLEWSTWIGVAAMVWIGVLVGWNILDPASHGRPWTIVLAPSHMTFPMVSIPPFKNDLYVLFLMTCGCLMHLRFGATPARSGVAAMKISFIAGMPILVVGLFVGLGLMQVPAAGYPVGANKPGGLAVMTAPIARLGESWIWGTVGAQLGGAIVRGISRLRTRT